MDLVSLTKRNGSRWSAAKVTRDAHSTAKRLTAAAAKVRYQVIAQQTTVPWFIIAVIHEREASQSWTANLAQGDPWDRMSIHVPKGRGPFRSFEAAAVDALTNCSPHAAKWKDWSVGGAMTLLELYNGLGYADKGTASPYVWSGTDQYVKGKYVADGVYNPDVIDKQLGCACILKTMIELDPTITFTGAVISPVPPPVGAPKPSPSPPAPVSPPPNVTVWGRLASALMSIFQRKP